MDPLEDPVVELVCSLFDIAPEDVPPASEVQPGQWFVREESPRKSAVTLFERARN